MPSAELRERFVKRIEAKCPDARALPATIRQLRAQWRYDEDQHRWHVSNGDWVADFDAVDHAERSWRVSCYDTMEDFPDPARP